MISEDLAFFGYDATTWRRLISLFWGAAGDTEPRLRGVMVVLVDDDIKPTGCFHTIVGEIPVETLGPLDNLDELCRRQQARACCLVRDQIAPEVVDYLRPSLDPDRDYVSQVMRLMRLLHRMRNGGLVRMWPNPLAILPLPPAPTAQAALDVLLPCDQCVVLAVFDEGGLWTGGVLRRGKELDLLAGPTAMLDWTGPLGGDWRRDHRLLLDAVEREVAPVQIGMFMSLSAARRVFAERQGGAWALAFAARELILNPMPPYAAAGLGLDGLAGAAQMATMVFEQFDAAELRRVAEGFWRGFTDGQGLAGLLGFSPTEVISEVVREKLTDHESDV